MKGVHLVDKERGETLSELLRRFKKENSSAESPVTYAGRLDPMAEGLVILLSGDAIREKDIFLKLDKTYIVDILFGFRTDTGDVLGELLEVPSRAHLRSLSLTDLNRAIGSILGAHTDPYPNYSSKPIGGVPLFALARAGKLEDVEIPEHTYAILEAMLLGLRQIPLDGLLESIVEDINRVKGDFRQERIIGLWEEHTRSLYDLSFDVATIKVRATSGAYMRGIAEKIGMTLGVSALALRIRREVIGNYALPHST
jgi:tRNA pseudouridine(55) synthase